MSTKLTCATFTLPYCSYNIAICREDLEKLVNGGSVCIQPTHISTNYMNGEGYNTTDGPHSLHFNRYNDETYNIQYLTLTVRRDSNVCEKE